MNIKPMTENYIYTNVDYFLFYTCVTAQVIIMKRQVKHTCAPVTTTLFPRFSSMNDSADAVQDIVSVPARAMT